MGFLKFIKHGGSSGIEGSVLGSKFLPKVLSSWMGGQRVQFSGEVTVIASITRPFGDAICLLLPYLKATLGVERKQFFFVFEDDIAIVWLCTVHDEVITVFMG